MPNNSSEPILKVSGLNSHYGDFQALYDLDMSVEEGEALAIIGANGAGKSTLMRSVCGLISNDAAQVQYRGQNIGHLRADQVAKLGIALVPEGRQLFPSLSVEENLLIGGQIGREGVWSLQRVFELFPILEERRNVPSTALSGGQQQMVAIGRALMSNPDLLLMDEISLGLASVIIKTIYDALPGIIDEGMSVVIVEQDITKALSVSSRVYCLQEGRVSLEGQSSTVSRDEISRAYFGVE
ncbi:MAG: ABC transporter ATP-binding protein [Rhizobiaceae bacterium]|nr:ABC transporter ATP-binding protein [Rhizobiaceae bacterium]